LQVADKVYGKVMTALKEYLESRGIGGGELIEARIKDMIASAYGLGQLTIIPEDFKF
jgi:hypothetical protein